MDIKKIIYFIIALWAIVLVREIIKPKYPLPKNVSLLDSISVELLDKWESKGHLYTINKTTLTVQPSLKNQIRYLWMNPLHRYINSVDELEEISLWSYRRGYRDITYQVLIDLLNNQLSSDSLYWARSKEAALNMDKFMKWVDDGILEDLSDSNDFDKEKYPTNQEGIFFKQIPYEYGKGSINDIYIRKERFVTEEDWRLYAPKGVDDLEE